jgi:hypothetical protein
MNRRAHAYAAGVPASEGDAPELVIAFRGSSVTADWCASTSKREAEPARRGTTLCANAAMLYMFLTDVEQCTAYTKHIAVRVVPGTPQTQGAATAAGGSSSSDTVRQLQYDCKRVLVWCDLFLFAQ